MRYLICAAMIGLAAFVLVAGGQYLRGQVEHQIEQISQHIPGHAT